MINNAQNALSLLSSNETGAFLNGRLFNAEPGNSVEQEAAIAAALTEYAGEPITLAQRIVGGHGKVVLDFVTTREH